MTHGYPKFRNDRAFEEIRVGAREFECAGASPPHDHPHVYINMRDQDAVLCPYCATRFVHDDRLGALEADPPGCLLVDRDAVGLEGRGTESGLGDWPPPERKQS